MWMIIKAWNNFTEDTIANCVLKNDFKTPEEKTEKSDIINQPVKDVPVIAPTVWEQVYRLSQSAGGGV